MKTNITLKEFDKFLSSDLEINEINSEKFLKQGIFIKIKNSLLNIFTCNILFATFISYYMGWNKM